MEGLRFEQQLRHYVKKEQVTLPLPATAPLIERLLGGDATPDVDALTSMLLSGWASGLGADHAKVCVHTAQLGDQPRRPAAAPQTSRSAAAAPTVLTCATARCREGGDGERAQLRHADGGLAWPGLAPALQ